MEIIDYARSLSDVCGVADLETDRERLIATYGEDILTFPYALVLGHRMNPKIIEKIPESYSNKEYALEYLNEYYDSFKRISKIAGKIANLINEKGFDAIILDGSGQNERLNLKRSFSNKASASIAGLGWIGKNAMLINKDHGPRLTWCTILTNAPLKDYAGKAMKSLCGKCTACIDACPSGAIKDDANPEVSYNPNKCGAYLKSMWQKNHSMACGMCLYICPYGQNNEQK